MSLQRSRGTLFATRMLFLLLLLCSIRGFIRGGIRPRPENRNPQPCGQRTHRRHPPTSGPRRQSDTRQGPEFAIQILTGCDLGFENEPRQRLCEAREAASNTILMVVRVRSVSGNRWTARRDE